MSFSFYEIFFITTILLFVAFFWTIVCWCNFYDFFRGENLNQEELHDGSNLQDVHITLHGSDLHPVTCQGGNDDISRMIKILRENPNSLHTTINQHTPLSMAMQMHHVRCVNFLFQQGSAGRLWDLTNAFRRSPSNQTAVANDQINVLLLVKLYLQFNRGNLSEVDADFYGSNYEIIATCTVNHWNTVLQFMLEDGFTNDLHENWDVHYIYLFAMCCETLNFIALKLLFVHGFHLNLSKSHLSNVIINKLFFTYFNKRLFEIKEHRDTFVAVLKLFRTFGCDLWNSGNKVLFWKETEIARLFTGHNLDHSSNYDAHDLMLVGQVRTLMCIPRSLLDLSRQSLHEAIGRKFWKHVPLLNIPRELKLYSQYYGVTFLKPETLPQTALTF